ncbi:uncharacterized protein LOC125835557 [Solanum verrucosum]|uniref:uncharacterized protein LOC125835557 n=1 Tax=Solanum verrucosum TaxID=315347 RepID=UPI0020D16D90|nr:uncharacterized protein LOC125835557 [Solanum verrucosum]
MLIGDIDITRLMVYVQQVEEEKLRDREEFRNKKAKTWSESGQQRSNVNRCFKFGQEGHLMKECPKNQQSNGNQGNIAQSSSVAPPNMVAPRGSTFGTGRGANLLYAITSRQEQENSPDVVTGKSSLLMFML